MPGPPPRWTSWSVLVALLVGLACSGDDDAATTTDAVTAATAEAPTTAPVTTTTPPTLTSPPTEAPPSTGPPTTGPPTTGPAGTDPPLTTGEPTGGSDVAALVAELADDRYEGRDEGSAGWRLAQEHLAGQLAQFAEPVSADRAGTAGFLQAVGDSVNVIGIIPGTDLADEYVVIGGHYDHLGSDCATSDPADEICNGATDNAAGVAVAMEAARHLAEAGGGRRSVLVAFWDREEDGLAGAADFLAAPVVPLERIIAYLNFDIQGSNLLPSLRTTTVMVGTETGGPNLEAAATAATAASTLDTLDLSVIFGQGRSDHAVFVSAGVPSVFFTDANNGCYHTSQDDFDALDAGKLDQQLLTAQALLVDLASTDARPSLVADAPLATFADAASMLAVVTKGQADLDRFAPDQQATFQQYMTDLDVIVGAGEAAFDDAAVGTVLAGAAALVDALASLPCDGYLAD